ncbi:MAG: ATP-binding cassette domain-containing protein [Nocardioidaceae bacterium]|nr:ATP-binding cassette domain-containing protein [Nocardioidaceae bacterium]MCL2613490.1 ATP-binding cassette domain-containing protein [Nocardioidaceae bacterium]
MTVLTTSAGRRAALLAVEGLSKRYGDRVVLDGFSLDVAAGEVVSLLGANGSGKSTALRCIAGLDRPDGGTVSAAGERTRLGTPIPSVAMVFQRIHLVPRRTALDNVCAGALGRLGFRESWSSYAFPRALREEAMACLDRVGLADRCHEKAGRLSGGQQQRVAIARALCQRASVILADEPVSALDPAAADQVMRLFRSLADEDGMAIAAVLHQPDLAKKYSDRLVGLLRGVTAFDVHPDRLGERELEELYRPDMENES